MTAADAAYEKARREKERRTKELMALNNVVGVGVGRRPERGQGPYSWVIVVYVCKKLPASKLELKDIIPAEINGIPTDVIEIGAPANYDPNDK